CLPDDSDCKPFPYTTLFRSPFLELSPEEFEQVYRINVFGLAEVTRLVLPKMGPDGHVVTISSMGGVQGSVKFPGLSAYSSSKARSEEHTSELQSRENLVCRL